MYLCENVIYGYLLKIWFFLKRLWILLKRLWIFGTFVVHMVIYGYMVILGFISPYIVYIVYMICWYWTTRDCRLKCNSLSVGSLHVEIDMSFFGTLHVEIDMSFFECWNRHSQVFQLLLNLDGIALLLARRISPILFFRF